MLYTQIHMVSHYFIHQLYHNVPVFFFWRKFIYFQYFHDTWKYENLGSSRRLRELIHIFFLTLYGSYIYLTTYIMHLHYNEEWHRAMRYKLPKWNYHFVKMLMSYVEIGFIWDLVRYAKSLIERGYFFSWQITVYKNLTKTPLLIM